MAPNLLHLPNGQTITVSPVFGGLYFKSNDLSLHHAAFPPGWTIVLHAQADVDETEPKVFGPDDLFEETRGKDPQIHRYRKPTLRNDALFLSSISNPSSSDFKPAMSPSRQIAMMLWATLWWYFHQPAPALQLADGFNSTLPEEARPKGEWRINIKRDGIFKGRQLLSKLERMGLISTEQSSVGLDPSDRVGDDWMSMFVSQRAFWQIDPRIFLFTLSPTNASPFSVSPFPSRPSSPNRDSTSAMASPRPDANPDHSVQGLWSPSTPGPFTSSSHLPTYYPPAPTQYVMSNHVRHPLRPKPPRQGETFYTRYVPSLGQYLSFRVASLSANCVVHHGPVASPAATSTTPSFLPPSSAFSTSSFPTSTSSASGLCDTDLLHKWMNDARVSAAWGVAGPIAIQETFLRRALSSKHSFPVIGCWDGKPFGYFEVYWVKEDLLGKHINGVGDWDRGFHALVGEEEFRGKERVRVWLSAIVHWCWLGEGRTERVCVDPRVDNVKFIDYLQEAGFYKEREISFPFKQAALMRINREAWDAPAL